MCNLSEGIRDAGIAEGLAKGMAEGLAEGKAEGLVEGKIKTTMLYVVNLMKVNNFSAVDAMNILGVEEDIRPTILQVLQQNNN